MNWRKIDQVTSLSFPMIGLNGIMRENSANMVLRCFARAKHIHGHERSVLFVVSSVVLWRSLMQPIRFFVSLLIVTFGQFLLLANDTNPSRSEQRNLDGKWLFESALLSQQDRLDQVWSSIVSISSDNFTISNFLDPSKELKGKSGNAWGLWNPVFPNDNPYRSQGQYC